MKLRNLITPVVLSILLFSCLDDPDCVSTTTDFVNVRFYERLTGRADTLILQELTAMGSDSVLNMQDTVTAVRLPLDPGVGEATYFFRSQYGRDTLVLTYRLGTRLISEDCGVEILYTGIDYLRHSFDSVNIVNNVPVEEITEDIRIYN